MKAVIYARYSSDNQTENSIEGQLRECTEYADKHNITVIGTYIDRALSAKTDDRPEFQSMIRDSAQKQFDVIIVWKLDRFSRDRYDSAHYKRILKKNDVKVISATELISEGSTGILLESLIEGYAEFYSVELSEKVKRGQKENALKCKANGGAVPFGYTINSERYYEIDPLTAPIVLEIFTRYADGQTVGEISEELNSRSAFASTKHKYTNKASMHNLLKNRRYMGEYRYGDVVTPGGMPAIVPKDIFDKVQVRMEKNKHKPAAKKAVVEYILTTKLFCGLDGVMMVGVGGTSKTGALHHYYKCGNRIYRKTCDKKTVKKGWLERHIVALVKERVLRNDVIDRIADELVKLQNQENTTVSFLQKQLTDIQKRIDNLLNAIEEGLLNASAKARLDDLEMKKSDLEISIAKEKLTKTPLTKKQIVFWISKFKYGDIDNPEYRRQMVDIFINSVYLYEDRVVIAFNFKDGTTTVTLAELEDAVEGYMAGKARSTNNCESSHLGDNPPFFYYYQYANIGDNNSLNRAFFEGMALFFFGMS